MTGVRSGVCCLLAALALPAGGGAQTNDHLFRSWRWTSDATAPRAAGLAGAMTAVADDASAVLHNPAGLAALTKSEVAMSLLSRRRGHSPHGDLLSPRTGIGFAVAAARLGPRWVLAASVSESHARRVRLDDALALPDGVAETGSVEAVVTELALAAAWRLTPRLSIGARGAARRLGLEGGYSREPAGGPVELRMETTAQATRTSAGVGLVLEPVRRLRVAASASSGTRWRVRRTAVSPLLGSVLDEGSGYDVSQPRVLSAAVAFEPSLKLRLTAQVDHVGYGEIRSSLVIGQGAHERQQYELEDAWEPRVGLEASLPRRAASVQLRGGLHWQAPSALRYVGPDAVERASFIGAKREAVLAVGASLVTSGWLRMDLAAQFARERHHLLAGLALRF